MTHVYLGQLASRPLSKSTAQLPLCMILGWRTRTTHTRFHLHKLKSVVCNSQLLRRAYIRSQDTASRIPSAVQKPQKDGPGASLDPARPGTMPERSVYLVLHTSTPSASWPAVHSKASPLVNNLSLNLKPFHGMVNVSHDPLLHLHSDTFAFPSAAEYPATLYRSGGLQPLFVPRLALETIDSVITLLKENHAPPSADLGSGQAIGNVNFGPTCTPFRIDSAHSRPARHLYVCTHNARDCRCGTVGLEIFKTLSTLCALPTSSASSSAPRVQEIGHIGGHNYAANILDFPNGDMYGGVWPSNIEAFTRALLASAAPFGADAGPTNRSKEDTKLLSGFWRGRLGMSSMEQESFHTNLVERLESQLQPQSSEPTGAGQMVLGDKPLFVPLVFETHDGSRIRIDAEEGKSVMEVAKKNGIPSIEGTCGGKLEV